jgi:hypothetical protein
MGDDDELDMLIEAYEAQARSHDAAVGELLGMALLGGGDSEITHDIEEQRHLADTCRNLAQEVRDSRT